MGCGIYFPVDYELQQVVLQAEEEEEEEDPVNNDSAGSNDEDEEDDDDDLEDEHEEEDYIDPRLRQGRRPNTKGVVVEVRFCVWKETGCLTWEALLWCGYTSGNTPL